jgi:mono/diheme cytochrome c family protein
MKGHRNRPSRGMPFRRAAGAVPRATGPRTTLRAFLWLLALVLLLVGAVAYSIVRRGLSAHDDPSHVEEVLARAMRHLATPQAVRDRSNPLQPTSEVIGEALQHYADHCATCHANDGSGETPIGRSMFPRVPDMREGRTQSLTDGELFSIIEHGIRLTGMPAWGNGTPEGERQSWGLVHFVRRLPRLTEDEIARMESLNPKTPAQLAEEEEARRFLRGETPTSSGKVSPERKH